MTGNSIKITNIYIYTLHYITLKQHPLKITGAACKPCHERISKMLISIETKVRIAISAMLSMKNTGLLIRKILTQAIRTNIIIQITNIVIPIVGLIVSTCLTLHYDNLKAITLISIIQLLNNSIIHIIISR